MDTTLSAAQVARRLGTSVPRVVRAAQRLGYDIRVNKGRFSFDAVQLRRLREELGISATAPGLTASETAAMAALARAPLGLPSARAVAARAGLSPTAASRAVQSLRDAGLVRREQETIAAGRPRRVAMLRADRANPRYREIAPTLREVTAPSAPRERRVPSRLAHNFWNTTDTRLEVDHVGEYIARRLLRTQDPDGLAWGARNLKAEDWRAAAHARGLDAATRRLALNLADNEDD